MHQNIESDLTQINGENEYLWTVRDVANYLRLAPGTVQKMARDKKIPGFKFGKFWRFIPGDIKTIANP
jgi:excisionase family DNA binding protein